MEKTKFSAAVIEASAGTGKTYRLTREFLGLLDRENLPASCKKIMAVTFSEKAALEMKKRILQEIFDNLFAALSGQEKIRLENALFDLRVSTIHSFCQTLLRRFSLHCGLDPFFTIIDQDETDLLFSQAVGAFLNAPERPELVLELARVFKLKHLIDLLTQMKNTHPQVFLGEPGPVPGTRKILYLYGVVSRIHQAFKEKISSLDFNDLEKMTYQLLTENPQSLLVLEDFDERFNFLLVDEFQDTNVLQWEIVHKLAEEWLAGYGARAETGQAYGIFLVGDRKQSIYGFRGAEIEVFDRARGVLQEYLKTEQLSVSQRSFPEIIEFANDLFGQVPPWNVQKLKPAPRSFPAGLSRIEINLLPEDRPKKDEYQWVAEKIIRMQEPPYEIYDWRTAARRPLVYRDVALLLRRRTRHLHLLEQVLAERGIPYLILGGIGFYQEPEVLFLLSLVFSLADDTDGPALWNLRNSVHKISEEQVSRWRKRLSSASFSILLESILKEISFWEGLNTQQRANVEKFLCLVQREEKLPVFQVSQNLRKLCVLRDEPKADVYSEQENAVKIITVHGAKGLEFPAVFLLNAEDGKVLLKNRIYYQKHVDRTPAYSFVLAREANEDQRRAFTRILAEEEERILYVAVTRAIQYLFLSGKADTRSLWVQRISKLKDRFPPSNVESGS